MSSQSFIRRDNKPSFDESRAQDMTADATRNLLFDKLNESSTASFNQGKQKSQLMRRTSQISNDPSYSSKVKMFVQNKIQKDHIERSLSTLGRLNIDLHQREKMPTEIPDNNIQCALQEIERVNDAVPIDQRGGEVLDQVNEVFNLMAMNIKKQYEKKKHL